MGGANQERIRHLNELIQSEMDTTKLVHLAEELARVLDEESEPEGSPERVLPKADL
jgi:hypothetical protein